MAIHRWGEGVWARGVAMAIVALFIVWGAWDFYFVPKAASVIVEKSGTLTEPIIAELIEHKQSDPAARPQFPVETGFANQDVTQELVGAKVGANISTPSRGLLARTGDLLTKEQITAIQEAGIERIPIEGRANRKVDMTLVGAITAAPVLGTSAAENLIEKGTTVTAENRDDLIAKAKESVPPIGDENPKQIDRGEEKGKAWTDPAALEVGDIIQSTVFGAMKPATIFEAEKNLGEGDIKTLIEAGITTITVRPNGILYLDPTMGGTSYSAKNYAKFYFTAGETRNQKTWWTAEVWQIPLFGWSLTGGGIVCIAVMIALLVVAWNYLNRPKLVDILIETQLEMKKVSWPKGRELASSSIVVMAFIIFVAVWLALADTVFLWLASLIGVYGGK